MLVKRALALFVAVTLLATLAGPGMAMDRQSKIWLRDTLVGGGIGLAVGLISNNSAGTYVIAGLLLGGIFGYFDSEKHLVYQHGDLQVAALTGITVDALTIEGREKPVPELKANLLQARW
jgi:hypothetical protein